MELTVEMTARLTRLLNTPGITEKVRKQAERELKIQERHRRPWSASQACLLLRRFFHWRDHGASPV